MGRMGSWHSNQGPAVAVKPGGKRSQGLKPRQKPLSKIGENLRLIRTRHGLSLKEVAERSGISRSTLYKVENNGVSLTYDKIVQLSEGVGFDLAELFGRSLPEAVEGSPTRRSFGRGMKGFEVDTPHLTYSYLCNDLLKKRITPIAAVVKARSLSDYKQLTRHPGEEFDFVVSGEVEVYTEHYEKVRLGPGDFIYLDSMMGHAFISVSAEDAVVLTVNTSPPAPEELGDVAAQEAQ